MQSPELRTRVDEALGRCLKAVLSDNPGVSTVTQFVRAELKARACRGQIFDTDLFRDPAWDMLLDLYDAHSAGRVISVSSLCIAANVPATTGLRYVAAMEREGLVSRRRDKSDHRRVLIEASPSALAGVERVALRFAQAT
ncbi:winged helix DNA-binding protein [Sphingomonas bacterium]|uniref:winged helix DNA-binding protein n=1 Tax=Sphingomonas bacterium TaxID=1895847 RepID=UPI00157763AF|nr:winged helix DNA-binding protein [Sphingomonas bacterium]